MQIGENQLLINYSKPFTQLCAFYARYNFLQENLLRNASSRSSIMATSQPLVRYYHSVLANQAWSLVWIKQLRKVEGSTTRAKYAAQAA